MDDTNFADEEIVEIATEFDYAASVAAEIYRRKAALAMEDRLEEKSVGSEKLKFTKPKDLANHYLEMADLYDSFVPVADDEGSRLLEQIPPDVLQSGTAQGVDLSRLTSFESQEIL